MSLYFKTKLTNNQNKLNITGYEFFMNGSWTGERVRGQLSRMPGSPTIWVSHGLYVPPIYRHKGFSTEYNEVLKAQAFLHLGASAIIASVKHDNGPQQWRLEKLGWSQISNAIWIMRSGPDDDKSSEIGYYSAVGTSNV